MWQNINTDSYTEDYTEEIYKISGLTFLSTGALFCVGALLAVTFDPPPNRSSSSSSSNRLDLAAGAAAVAGVTKVKVCVKVGTTELIVGSIFSANINTQFLTEPPKSDFF